MRRKSARERGVEQDGSMVRVAVNQLGGRLKSMAVVLNHHKDLSRPEIAFHSQGVGK